MKTKVDPKIMADLLAEPSVKEHVAQMSPDEVKWYKDLLVSQGIYARYVLERQKEQLKQAVKGAFGKAG